jgi:hypothetical protein
MRAFAQRILEVLIYFNIRSNFEWLLGLWSRSIQLSLSDAYHSKYTDNKRPFSQHDRLSAPMLTGFVSSYFRAVTAHWNASVVYRRSATFGTY